MAESESAFVLATAGPLFVGVIGVWALLGSLTIQLYDYHNTAQSRKNADRLGIKLLVYGIYIIELAQTLIITQFAWEALIVNFGTVGDLINSPPYVDATPVLNGIVATSVQFFFAWRIWQLSTASILGRIAVALIVAISLVQFAGTIGVTVVFALVNTNVAEITKVTLFAELWLAGGFVCDVIIAVTMASLLWSAKSKSGFRSTETLLNRLIINTVETGAITATLALVELILFKKFSATYYHITVEYILGRMYSNVLLATLNGRHRSRNASEREINHFGTIGSGATSTGTELRAYVPGSSRGGLSDNSTVVISTSVHTDEVNNQYSGSHKASAL